MVGCPQAFASDSGTGSHQTSPQRSFSAHMRRPLASGEDLEPAIGQDTADHDGGVLAFWNGSLPWPLPLSGCDPARCTGRAEADRLPPLSQLVQALGPPEVRLTSPSQPRQPAYPAFHHRLSGLDRTFFCSIQIIAGPIGVTRRAGICRYDL